MTRYLDRQEAKLAEKLARLEAKHPHPASPAAERRKNRVLSSWQRWRNLKYRADRQAARTGLA